MAKKNATTDDADRYRFTQMRTPSGTMFMIHEELTGKIISAFYTTYNGLGYGFLEKVYENALVIELRKQRIGVEQQKRIEVFYEGQQVGDYYADLVVNDCVILELKAAEVLAPEHEAQLINYLKGTEIEVGLLLNFGPKPQIVRRILTNDRKRPLRVGTDTIHP